MRERCAADYHAARERVAALAATCDAETAFSSYVLTKVVQHRKDGTDEPTPALIEMAAFELMPFFGRGGTRDPREVEKLINALEDLAGKRAIHGTLEKETDDSAKTDLAGQLRSYALHVRGTAFPVQTLARINELFAPFENAMSSKFGIAPSKAAQLICTIAYVFELNRALWQMRWKRLEREQEVLKRLDNNPPPASIADWNRRAEAMMLAAPEVWPARYEDILRRANQVTAQEWSAFLEHFGYSPAIRAASTDPLTVQDRPVICLSGDRVLLNHLSAGLDAVFCFFDEAMRADTALREAYGRHVAQWMESRIETFAKRVFPAASVMREACYRDPDRPNGEASADLVISWGQFLVVCEAKGRLFKRSALRGDLFRLKNDLTKNIEEAFSQAQRLLRALAINSALILKEKATGQTATLDGAKLMRIFPLSVTLYHFAGLATQLAGVRSLGLFRADSFPYSVSIDDLDVITRFAGSPDAFLHYIERRLEMQRAPVTIHGDELDIFGHYLDTRLHPKHYWQHKDIAGHQGMTSISISGGSTRFDGYFNALFFGEKDLPFIGHDIPPRIRVLLEELRRRSEDGARWCCFALLGISPPGLTRLDSLLGKLSEMESPDGKIPRITFRDDDLLILAMANRGYSYPVFQENVMARSSIEKYRTRLKKVIGLGLNVGPAPEFVNCTYWEEGEWMEEPEMERILQQESQRKTATIVSRQVRRPGRNDPCVCGSGRKFKKCCEGKIEFR